MPSITIAEQLPQRQRCMTSGRSNTCSNGEHVAILVGCFVWLRRGLCTHGRGKRTTQRSSCRNLERCLWALRRPKVLFFFRIARHVLRHAGDVPPIGPTRFVQKALLSAIGAPTQFTPTRHCSTLIARARPPHSAPTPLPAFAFCVFLSFNLSPRRPGR